MSGKGGKIQQESMHGCLVCQVSICLVGDFFADSTMVNQLIKPPFGRRFFTCSRHFKQIQQGKGRNSESMDA